MGCGQSKINFYPRRSKSKGSAKKTAAAADNEESEEEEEAPELAADEPELEEPDLRQDVLPIAEHQPAFEVSLSQLDFFKMLDEKIEQGKDYDSTSETEVQEEEERRRRLVEYWRAHSQSPQSSLAQASPPAPAQRCLTRSVIKVSERQCAPGPSHLCHRQESPPTRREHSGQAIQDTRPCAGDWDPKRSPLKRTQSAGPTWRNNPKVAPMPKSKTDQNEAVAGCSKDSQITYNPTFQNSSPAKSQLYKAHVVSYPLTQQSAPSSPAKFITPPEEYQDNEAGASERHTTVTQTSSQSQIYYIHGSNAAPPDIVQQRQQTAIHLQQYVAMKQAQQQMFTSYLQRAPVASIPSVPGEYPAPRAAAPRLYEGEELAAQYGYPGPRPQSAPSRAGFDVAHVQTPLWSPMPPVMTTTWAAGQVPPEMQYYPQSQFMPMYRANSAGSAGTLTRYQKKEDKEKSVSINVVKGKPVGQIVSVGGVELAVSSAVSNSPSPASVSTDSGLSPGTSVPSSKSSFTGTPTTTSANEIFDPKPKRIKTGLKSSKSLDA